MVYYGDKKRAYQLQWMNARRQQFIDERGGKCEQCGSTNRIEVDHVDRSTKLVNPRGIWSRTLEFRIAELAKCQLLCNDCHKAKTSKEISIDHPHGTRGRYRKGCSCQPCKDANAAYRRETRARAKARIASTKLD